MIRECVWARVLKFFTGARDSRVDLRIVLAPSCEKAYELRYQSTDLVVPQRTPTLIGL